MLSYVAYSVLNIRPLDLLLKKRGNNYIPDPNIGPTTRQPLLMADSWIRRMTANDMARIKDYLLDEFRRRVMMKHRGSSAGGEQRRPLMTSDTLQTITLIHCKQLFKSEIEITQKTSK